MRDVLQNIHQITCITSRWVFFSNLILCKNDDDIVREGGGGMGSESYDRNYHLSENDGNWGPPLGALECCIFTKQRRKSSRSYKCRW